MTPRQRLIARLAYVGVILTATLTHLHFDPDLSRAAARTFWAFAEPLSWDEAVDGLRNIVLFGGLGAVWVVSAPGGTPRPRTRWVTLFAFALSVCIEGIQTFSPTRVASLLDVITDTTGAFAGAFAAATVLRAARRRGDAQEAGRAGVMLGTGAYLLAALLEALTPLFRSGRLAGAEHGPLARWHIAIEASRPLSVAEVPVLDVLLFVPAGVLAAVLANAIAPGARRAWAWTALAVVALLVPAHLGHGVMGRAIRWEALATDIVAVVAGAWLAAGAIASRLGAAWGRADGRVLRAYGALLALWGWRPFMPETSVRALAAKATLASVTPFAALSARGDVFSAAYVMQQVLLYLPLGVLLALAPPSDGGARAAMRIALWLAVAIEVGHLLVAGRAFDVTNVLLAWGGIGTGWVLIRDARAAAAAPAPSVRE